MKATEMLIHSISYRMTQILLLLYHISFTNSNIFLLNTNMHLINDNKIMIWSSLLWEIHNSGTHCIWSSFCCSRRIDSWVKKKDLFFYNLLSILNLSFRFFSFRFKEILVGPNCRADGSASKKPSRKLKKTNREDKQKRQKKSQILNK